MRTPRKVRSVYARPPSDHVEKIELSDNGEDKSVCQKSSRHKNSRKSTQVDGDDPDKPTECSTDISYRSVGQKQSSSDKTSASGRLVKERPSVSRKVERGKAGSLGSKSPASKASPQPSQPSKADGSEPASTTNKNQKEAASVSNKKKSRTAGVGKTVTTAESGDRKEASESSKSNNGVRGEPTAAVESQTSTALSSASDPLKDNTEASEDSAKLCLHGGDKRITHRKPYVCATCQKRYTTETHLREHELIHLKQKTDDDDGDDVQSSKGTEQGPPFKCDVCHKIYGSQTRLRKHQAIHSEEKNLMCEACGKSFSKAGTFKLHMLEHTGERPFVCDVCNKTYRRNFDLQQHKRLHTGERPYVCNVCEKAFTKMDYLKTHMQCHNGVKPFKCDECSQSFRRTDQLKAHTRTHTGVKLFECEICNKTFSTKNVLKKHMRSRVHDKRDPVPQTRCKICKVCGVQLGKNKSMKAHIMTHTGERPFVCEVCSKGFIIKYDWLVHMRTHTGERPFVCSICFASYPRNADLSQHIRIVHWGRRPYTCDICNEAFARHQQLKKHMVNHTKTVPHPCSQCGKGFIEAAALKSHMRTHTREKPFACTYCSTSFSDAGSRKRHMRRHTGEKPYKCNQCSAVFARAEPYKQHREVVHGSGNSVVTHTWATEQSVESAGQACSLSVLVSSEQGVQDLASQPSRATSVFMVKPTEAVDSGASERESGLNTHSLMRIQQVEMDDDTKSSVAGNIASGVMTESVDSLYGSVSCSAEPEQVKERSIYTLGTDVICQPLPPSYSCSYSSGVLVCSVGGSSQSTSSRLTHVEHEASGSAEAEPQMEDKEMVSRIIEVQVTHGKKGMPPKVIEVIYDSSVSQSLPAVGLETVVYSGTLAQDPTAAESETQHGVFFCSPREELEVETVESEDVAMEVEYADSEQMVVYGRNEEVKVEHAENETGQTVTASQAAFHGAESVTASSLTVYPAASHYAESMTCGAERAVNLTIEKSQRYSAAFDEALCLVVTDSKDSCHDVRNTTVLTGIESQVGCQAADYVGDNTITSATAVTGVESQTDSHGPVKYLQVYHADGTKSVTLMETQTAFDSNLVLEQGVVSHVERASTSSPTVIEVQQVNTIQIITADPTTSVGATDHIDTAIQNSLLEQKYLPPVVANTDADNKSNENGKPWAVSMDASVYLPPVVANTDADNKSNENGKPWAVGMDASVYLPPVVANTDADNKSNENGKPWAVSMGASVFEDIMKTQKTTSNKAKRRWICETCGNCFTHSASLKKHVTVQHGVGGDRAFVCDVCSRVCISRSELESHARKHTGERPFPCTLCSNSYKHKSDLRQHVLTVHMGERSHECDACHKTFTSGRGLKEHKLIHQGVKPHKCSTCGKAFTQLSTLTTHVLGTHSGLRPWVCQYCGKDFSDQSSLARHHRIHTGEKPYHCQHCPSTFARTEQLKKHLSKEHPGDLQNLTTLAEAVATIM